MSKIKQFALFYSGDYLDDLPNDISDQELLEKEKELFPDIDPELFDLSYMDMLDELDKELGSIKHPQHLLFNSIYQWLVFKPDRSQPNYIWLDKFISNLVNDENAITPAEDKMSVVTLDRLMGIYYTEKELGRDDYFRTDKPIPIQKIVWVSHDDGKTATLVGLYDLENMIGYTFHIYRDILIEKHATIKSFPKDSVIYEMDEFKPCVYAEWHTRFWCSIDDSKENFKQYKEKYRQQVKGEWEDNCIMDMDIIGKIITELKDSIQELNDKFNDPDFCNSAYNPRYYTQK